MKSLMLAAAAVLTITSFLSSAVVCQTPNSTAPPRAACALTIEDLPSIRGFQLGMPESDLGGMNPLPAMEFKSGVRDVAIPIADPKARKDHFHWARVFEGKVSSFMIDFDPEGTWRSRGSVVTRVTRPDELIDQLSKELKLPVAAWDFSNTGDGRMVCKDFKVQLDSGTRRVRIYGTEAQRKIDIARGRARLN